MVIEIPVGRLSRIATPKVQVRFVPDFEIPLADFRNAVAVDQVFCKRRDQVVPPHPIFWGSDVGLVPEGMRHVPGGQFLRHEAQLYEGTHPVGQQAVINLIQVRKVVERLALLVFIIDTNFVVKDGVEAHILKAGDLFDFPQVLTIAVTQGQHGPT